MSILSMTGFGRGSATGGAYAVDVEVSSVNRKQLDVVLSIPRNLQVLDSRVQEEVRKKLSRGRITCSIAISRTDSVSASSGKSSGAELIVNEVLAEQYYQGLRRISDRLELPLDVGADFFLRCPEVFSLSEQGVDAEACWPVVRKALRPALAGLVAMRGHEGDALEKDLQKRLGRLKRLTAAIDKRSSNSAESYRITLMDRLEAAGLPLALDDPRILKEVAIFAEKADFTEEVTRLVSHFEQFGEKLGQKKAKVVGRALDFLCQEIFREISTLGVKASDAAVGQAVVEFKAELEKLREQVQNVE